MMAAGTQLGPYELLSLLGAGGMGERGVGAEIETLHICDRRHSPGSGFPGAATFDSYLRGTRSFWPQCGRPRGRTGVDR